MTTKTRAMIPTYVLQILLASLIGVLGWAVRQSYVLVTVIERHNNLFQESEREKQRYNQILSKHEANFEKQAEVDKKQDERVSEVSEDVAILKDRLEIKPLYKKVR